jgi:hypothetical protein
MLLVCFLCDKCDFIVVIIGICIFYRVKRVGWFGSLLKVILFVHTIIMSVNQSYYSYCISVFP